MSLLAWGTKRKAPSSPLKNPPPPHPTHPATSSPALPSTWDGHLILPDGTHPHQWPPPLRSSDDDDRMDSRRFPPAPPYRKRDISRSQTTVKRAAPLTEMGPQAARPG